MDLTMSTTTTISTSPVPDHDDHGHHLSSSSLPPATPQPSVPPIIPACDPHDGPACLQLIEDLTTHAGAMQRRILGKILAMNTGTDYLRGFLGADAEGYNTSELAVAFKERVPVVEYEDVKPYIERIANGAPSSLISSKPITELLTSSGTSGGQPKLMPSTEDELDRKTFLYNLLVPVMNKYIEGLDEGRGMYLLFVKPEIATPSGLVARPVLTSYYKSRHFRQRPDSPYTRYTSPNEAILCPDSAQSMYAQLLCGLARRGEVLRVGAVFASAFLRAVKFLEGHWRAICDDIRAGRVDGARVTDLACKEAVGRVVSQPEPALADAIAAECAAGSWQGIVRRLWPRTKYIDVIVTGSMAQYIPLLEFYGDGLPLVSTMYASSESYFGINLRPLDRPEDVAYTLLPNMCYYEFIKVEKDGEEVREGKVVDLVDVEVGGYYELVVTTFTGLYRYRVGDILQVSGFHNAAPQFRFVHRRNVVVSIDTDKTSEDDLLRAVTAAKRLLAPLGGAILSEYTAYADTASIPGHYVLFWELTPPPLASDDDEAAAVARVMAACCAAVEAGLDAVYRRCRSRDRSVGPLEIRVVSPGAFDALMDLCVSHGSSVNQYKTPRCIKHPDAIAVLEARVIGRFFSDAVPHWEPFKVDAAANPAGDATAI
ncbi:probable indole-3-acetic acid-amido synthetase GH3.13 [Phragmites australis]|uniref:probable indole-3-acetic acid-amido synthetase GH3.13 n=1 Tax=Phragmites australis TaxID=29695 RepID=UPI002D79E116|nr:probable indole-3-acetic acid-amido synthetase GH3.13 [Phragmites australis]